MNYIVNELRKKAESAYYKLASKMLIQGTPRTYVIIAIAQDLATVNNDVEFGVFTQDKTISEFLLCKEIGEDLNLNHNQVVESRFVKEKGASK